MPAPYEFANSTPNQGLPMLFAGQSQKEFFVNQAFAIIDALLQQCVTSSVATPPQNPTDGAVFRVTEPAKDAWIGHEDDLALSIGGGWHFVSPQAGVRVFDQAAGQSLAFTDQWQAATLMPAPTGGAVVDAEARAAIADLIQELERVGLIG